MPLKFCNFGIGKNVSPILVVACTRINFFFRVVCGMLTHSLSSRLYSLQKTCLSLQRVNTASLVFFLLLSQALYLFIIHPTFFYLSSILKRRLLNYKAAFLSIFVSPVVQELLHCIVQLFHCRVSSKGLIPEANVFTPFYLNQGDFVCIANFAFIPARLL